MRLLILAAAFWIAGSAICSAFELGLILGEPTGLSVSVDVGEHSTIAGAAAWSFEKPRALHLHFDYLNHWRITQPTVPPIFSFYLGVGTRFKACEDNARVGIRLPLGIEANFRPSRLMIFVEIAPIVDILPASRLRLNGGFGIRYRFG